MQFFAGLGGHLSGWARIHRAQEIAFASAVESVVQVALQLRVHAFNEMQVGQIPIGIVRFVREGASLRCTGIDINGQIGTE